MTPQPAGRVLLRGDLVASGHRLDDALVLVADGRIAWVGPATSWPGDDDLPDPSPGRLILPGLVDVHCHGGAGHGFPEADAAGMRDASDHHLRHGTTALLGSLVSAPADRLAERVRALLPLVASGHLAGIHLEGPFLSAARCGAQDPRSIVPGDPALLHRLIETGEGTIRSVTLAPETPRLTELLDVLAAADVTPSFGHTDASAAGTRAAIAAVGGRRLGATHLFNGMPPLHSRAPGPSRHAWPPRHRERWWSSSWETACTSPTRPSRWSSTSSGPTGSRWSPTPWPRPACPTAAIRWAR